MKLKNKKTLKFLNLHQVNYLYTRAHSYLKIFNNLPIKVALLQPKKSNCEVQKWTIKFTECVKQPYSLVPEKGECKLL